MYYIDSLSYRVDVSTTTRPPCNGDDAVSSRWLGYVVPLSMSGMRGRRLVAFGRRRDSTQRSNADGPLTGDGARAGRQRDALRLRRAGLNPLHHYAAYRPIRRRAVYLWGDLRFAACRHFSFGG